MRIYHNVSPCKDDSLLRCQLLRFIVTADVLHNLMQLISKSASGIGMTVHSSLPYWVLSIVITQHHFRVVNKVAVEGYALRSQPQMHPIRLDINGMVSLLQENDIRHYICTGIGTECVVWKSNGSQQFCPLRQILFRASEFLQSSYNGWWRKATTGTNLNPILWQRNSCG